MNTNQIIFIGILSIANEKQNIRNITWNDQGWKTDIFVGIGETNSPDWSCMVATQVTDILFGGSLSGKLKKREPPIGDMEIIPSLRK